MAVFTAQAARDNIRVNNGKRVFYLAEGDHLTPSAMDWLRAEGVEILQSDQPAEEKPEHMTHLRADQLVSKTDPRITFRGMLDTLEAEVLLYGPELREVLDTLRRIMRCDVLNEPMAECSMGGLTADELREHSHHPQKYYGQPHFMPDFTDDRRLLELNRIRTLIRQTELAACRALPDREDIIRTLNRLSSLLWIMMIRRKAQEMSRPPQRG